MNFLELSFSQRKKNNGNQKKKTKQNKTGPNVSLIYHEPYRIHKNKQLVLVRFWRHFQSSRRSSCILSNMTILIFLPPYNNTYIPLPQPTLTLQRLKQWTHLQSKELSPSPSWWLKPPLNKSKKEDPTHPYWVHNYRLSVYFYVQT